MKIRQSIATLLSLVLICTAATSMAKPAAMSKAEQRAVRLVHSHIEELFERYHNIEPAKFGFDSYISMAAAYRHSDTQAELSYYLYALAAEQGVADAYYHLSTFYSDDSGLVGPWYYDLSVAEALLTHAASLGSRLVK